jgi:hypothetical protein
VIPIRHIGLTLAAALIGLTPGLASAKAAHCVITTAQGRYEGPCRFSAQAEGSFNVARTRSGHLLMGVTDISVTRLGDGPADVRGLTPQGINSEWGPATRSRSDPACWKGDDFMICVYRGKSR